MHFGLSNDNVVHESFVPCHDVMESSSHRMSHGAYGSMPTARPAHAGATTTPTQPLSPEPQSPGRKSSRIPVSPRRLSDFEIGRPPPAIRRSYSQATEPTQPQHSRAGTPAATTAHTTSATTTTPPRLRRHRSAPNISGSNVAMLSPPQLDGTGAKQPAHPQPTFLTPVQPLSIPPMDAHARADLDASLAEPPLPARPRSLARRTQMHPDPDTLAPRPIANASTHPVTRTVTAITNGKRCPICDQTTRSKQDLLKHIRSTHMMGQLAEIQTMREAGIPVCQRCGVFVVGGLTKTHEDECKYHYDGSAHKALLDKLTVATLQWAKLPLQALEHQLTALTWPRTTSSAPAHVHLPRASQFKVAIATVLSKVAQLCENPPYINAGHKLLLWLPRLILTASPTAKLPSDMDKLAASRLLML